MRLDAFDYHLPQSSIAQRPCRDRSGSRLLVVDRHTGEREHTRFRDITRYVSAGDVVVVNRSRVMAARLFVRRRSGGRVELLVVEIMNDAEFIAIGSPLRRLKRGDELFGCDTDFSCKVIERIGDRRIRIGITSNQSVKQVLDDGGHVPLPPYIDRPDADFDRTRYQTVFAKEDGSVAAPTAGFHFDDDVLQQLSDRDVAVCSLVLHVGLGTFLPLDNEIVEDNTLHEEAFSVDSETIATIQRAKVEGGRVIAVGTTVTRVLETLGPEIIRGDAGEGRVGRTDLFIYPGCTFKIVDALITNFHLPRSSLLLLVCAFLGTDRTLDCYREAVDAGYRFYSYGDAMFIRAKSLHSSDDITSKLA